MKVNDKRRKPLTVVVVANATSEYCENLERYDLDPAREEDGAIWHYERIAYCRDARRTRVRCRKSIPGSK